MNIVSNGKNFKDIILKDEWLKINHLPSQQQQ